MSSFIEISGKLYRKNVAIIVWRADGKVLFFKRNPNKRDYVPIANSIFNNGRDWQFPQGGIDEGEDPAIAARRELFEETGIKTIGAVRELGAIEYSFPDAPAKRTDCGTLYWGQYQTWFAVEFRGEDSEILSNGTAELVAYEWVEPTLALADKYPDIKRAAARFGIEKFLAL
ncbi:MAG: NUDIX domain-containing protein [Alphaproteobacteria bacterium]|nr:NUDIX domain-containing protein [Alphaproteobacteria bacterium]